MVRPDSCAPSLRIAASALALLVMAACGTSTSSQEARSSTFISTSIPTTPTLTQSPTPLRAPPTPTVKPAIAPAHISPLSSPLDSPLAVTAAVATPPGKIRLHLPFVNGPRPTPTPPPTPEPTLTPTPSPTPLPTDPILGINVADTRDVSLLRQLGFGWIEVFLPPTAPVPTFKILYRIELGDAVSGREEDVAQFGRVVDGVVRDHGRYIDAYAVGNEPNLSREWKGGQPDPRLYTRLLKLAYEKIKASDESATVVSAGLAPTGGDGPGFADDLAYARAMFEANAASAFDAYGFHPYGFGYPPEQDPRDTAEHNGLTFRRAEAHRALMEQFGAGDKQMWATEFGWLLNPSEEGVTCDWPEANWQKVSARQQADYLLRAYRYARTNWSWMGPMFVWNFDFSRSALYPDKCEQMKWYSLVDEEGKLRQVATQLATRLQAP